ncbi:hypothetical protein BIY23_03995 [Wolbachia pipientis]|uniref:Uncharacterized protein n=1 Tax=Wolbachia pipientis TaxID=955 RepID=A0A1E7QJN5_WOLPI|nr:hypothetical protein [Wolbachia pipientis]OEY86449.1 hypothetical protein BIY23_03995 [Wolbachia pipientis]
MPKLSLYDKSVIGIAAVIAIAVVVAAVALIMVPITITALLLSATALLPAIKGGIIMALYGGIYAAFYVKHIDANRENHYLNNLNRHAVCLVRCASMIGAGVCIGAMVGVGMNTVTGPSLVVSLMGAGIGVTTNSSLLSVFFGAIMFVTACMISSCIFGAIMFAMACTVSSCIIAPCTNFLINKIRNTEITLYPIF